MNFTKILVTVGAVSLMAGCGGSNNTPPGGQGSSTANAQKAASLAHQLGQCIRDHGVPGFPDLVQTAGGGWDVPSGTPLPPASAQAACKSLSDQLPGGSSGPKRQAPKVTAEQMAAWRKWSQCVRQQGIPDWPDPNPDGSFNLSARLANDTSIPEKVFGLTACTPLRPQGLGLRIGTTVHDGG